MDGLTTNYYTSSYTKVIKEYTEKITGPKGANDEHRRNIAMRNVENKARALEILLGMKKNSDRPMTLSHTQQVIYNNYSASGSYIYIHSEYEAITVDNSGPCTTNTSLDSTIHVESYINEAQKQNDSNLDNAGDEFHFFNRDTLNSVSTAYHKALQKYNYLHQEAMKHKDPKQYIYDKYNNRNSPFFASDLTEEQRSISYRYEKNMMKYGEISGVDYHDSLFAGTVIYGPGVDADEKVYNRRMMNNQFINILNKAGINIPDGVNLTCSVEPLTCMITISDITNDGQDRSGLCAALENALNVGNNGLELYQHIMDSSKSMERDENSQYDYEGRIKFYYYHNIDGASYGMSGDYNANFVKYCEKYYQKYADKAKEVGFDGFENMTMQIGLNCHGFYDVLQDVNWSDPTTGKINTWYSKTEYSVLSDITNTQHLTKCVKEKYGIANQLLY